jgi:hypothetical protein
MQYRDLEPVSKQLTIVVGLTVIGFMAFGLALSFYRNVLFEQTLENIASQNDRLRMQIAQTKSDLDYFQSVQYKDKYAKENLGKLNPGEKSLVILEPPKVIAALTGNEISTDEQREAAFDEYLRQLPILEHWRLYLFHRDEIEKLKAQL